MHFLGPYSPARRPEWAGAGRFGGRGAPGGSERRNMVSRGGATGWARALGATLLLLGAALPGPPAGAAIDPPEIEATLQRGRLELHASVIQLESRTEGETDSRSEAESAAGFLGFGLGPVFLGGGTRSDTFRQEALGTLERVASQRGFGVASVAWAGLFGSAETALVVSVVDAYRRDEYDLRNAGVDFTSRLRTDTDGKYGLSLLFPLLVAGYFAGNEKQRFAAAETLAAPVSVRESYRYPVETAFVGFRRDPRQGFALFLFALATRGHAAAGKTADREASEESLVSAALGYRFSGGRRVGLTYNQRFEREAFEDVKLTRRRVDSAGLEVQLNEALAVGVSHEVAREKNKVLTTFPVTEAVKTASTLDLTWNY